MEIWLRVMIGFGLSSLCILIPAVVYAFCETVSHLARTAGTMRFGQLWLHTSNIDALCVLFEILSILGNFIFAFYLILIYGHLSNNVILSGYGCLFLALFGFVLLLIKYFLCIKLFNIFIEWNRQKTLLIKQNKDILLPSHEDIIELHGLLSDIKSHELDVAMFDLFGIALHNLPIIAIIVILTLFEIVTFGKNNGWKTVNILPLIAFLLNAFVILWKFMKLIVVKSGCNDSSDVPSKFASFNFYRPSTVEPEDENNEKSAFKITKGRVLNIDEEGDTPDDENKPIKDAEGGGGGDDGNEMGALKVKSVDTFDNM